tara:strand:- start:1565 stop:2500 length:936 start_codon:yes stop_codon:yes gene_type:complete
MILKRRIVFFWIIFFSLISTVSPEINLKIIMKVNNEIITSYDIEKEYDYLIILNPKLETMSKKQILEISRKSLIKETIMKNEILKYKELNLQNPQIEFILNELIKNLGFQTLSQFQTYLEKFDISIDDIKEKIEIENQWKSLVYARYSNSLKIDLESLKKKIENTNKQKFLLEYNLSEIIFTKKNNSSLDNLIKEIKDSIKNVGFENTAILYSISDSSKFGGKIGWIRENNLSNNIIKYLEKLELNTSREPMKIDNNFLILKINDKRKIPFKIDKQKELDRLVRIEKANQLEKFSNIFYNKIKLNSKINEF